MSRSSAAARVGQLAVLLEHHAPLQEVGARVDQHALGLEAVAAGAARLLLVVLERLRRAGVDTKRTSERSMPMPNATVATTTSASSFEERVLVAVPLVVRQAGVVRPRAHAGVAAATPPARRLPCATCSR